jgi:DNA polymerase
MRLHHLKLDDGKRLLDKFSKPRNPTKGDPRTRIRPEDDPADAILLYRYCDVDVLAENEAAAQLPPLDGQELAYWLADQRINRRGVAIDVQSVEACAAIVGQAHERYNAELRALTGGAVEKASQVQELATWLRTLGVPVGFGAGSMDEDALEAMLKLPGLPPLARRALEIRAAIGSAAVKKLYAMQRQCAGGRLHDLFNFHAAHTGRPTGDGPQPTNLPNSGPRVYRCDCGRHFGQHLRACPWCGVPA